MNAETSNARGETYTFDMIEDAWGDAVPLTKPYFNRFRARLETLRQSAAPPPAGDAEVWLFKGTDGEWRTFHNEQHRLDTIADGRWDVRKFYARTPPPADAQQQDGGGCSHEAWEENGGWCECVDCGHGWSARTAPQISPVGVDLHDRVEFALRDAGFDYDEASRIATLAQQTAAAPRSTHRVWRGDDWQPCYCEATNDHRIGSEQPTAVDEAMLERACDAYVQIADDCMGLVRRKAMRAALTAAFAAQHQEPTT